MFNLNILKKDHQLSVERTIEYQGLQITFEVKTDAEFERAFAELQRLDKSQTVTKDSLKRGAKTQIDEASAWLFLTGEYLVKDWNVTVDDEPFAINGDNFIIVLGNAFDDAREFVQLITDTVVEMLKEYAEKAKALKKKSMTNTNGKKSKQA
ncbi:hypothetical protein ACFBZI_08635 [Moraxella sp. ZJ142]|uniref:hypothetical protein n=1 Tax=Moraxella marmotae TaxID=3344520 RepID=UPI0035D49472